MAKKSPKQIPYSLLLAIFGIILLFLSSYLALANVAPINTTPWVFAVALVPLAIEVAAFVLCLFSPRARIATFIIAAIGFALAFLVLIFFAGSAILWSAG